MVHRADARLALVFAPGPQVKAVGALLAHHLETWATKHAADAAAARRTSDVLEAVNEAVAVAQTALRTAVVLLLSPSLPPLP